MRRSTLVIVSLAVASAAAFAPSAIAGNPPVVQPAAPPDVKPVALASASLAPGDYDLTFTAQHVGGRSVSSSSTTFPVVVTSQGSQITLSDPSAAAGSAAASTTGNGAFLGKAFSLHLVVDGRTVLLSAAAPSATALTTLDGSFVESASKEPVVDGTFSLQHAPHAQAHAQKIKQYGSSGSSSSNGSSTGTWQKIKNWFSSLNILK